MAALAAATRLAGIPDQGMVARAERHCGIVGALAGAFAGVMMAMVFLPHAAMILVFSRDFSGWPKGGAGMSPNAWLIAFLAASSVISWTLLGVAAALVFSLAQRRAPTYVPGIPSLAYLLGVVVIVLLTLPWVLIFGRRLWKHALFECAVFLAIFGVQIPMTAGVG